MADINRTIKKRKDSLSGHHYTVSNILSQYIYNYFNYTFLAANNSSYGSIFNIEFNPSQHYTVLVANENKAITSYDCRISHKKSPILTIPNAHDNCVNVITFIDNFTFASGSDDNTIRLWDLRQCGSCRSNDMDKGLMYILHGHEGWVKNIEYDSNSNSLYSMAFNDGVRKWDINNCHMYTNTDSIHDNNLLFEIKEGTRMKLSPDGHTMIVSLRKDHLFIVSKFNGLTLNSSYPQRPLCINCNNNDHNTLEDTSQICTANEYNIPSLHRLWPLASNSYHSPLSLSFHPTTYSDSNQLLAMRTLGVHMYDDYYSIDEQLLLYDTLLGRENDAQCHYYYHEHGDRNSIKYLKACREYSQETSINFIKEISFSSDGRLIVSPHGNTVRLLAVDLNCTCMDMYYDERFHCNDAQALLEHNIGESFVCCDSECNDIHDSPVLTCRLNSDIMCLVSGSLKGTIAFTWPHL